MEIVDLYARNQTPNCLLLSKKFADQVSKNKTHNLQEKIQFLSAPNEDVDAQFYYPQIRENVYSRTLQFD
jgi:hypothetical protein